jgi:hypothetical protein
MAGYKDEDIPAIFGPHLQPGEQLMHWAYGVKQPNFFLIILFVATLNILTYVFTKNYLVGLTNMGRFLVLEMSGKTVKKAQAYQLGQMQGVEVSTGLLFTHMKVKGPVPWVAKFHRAGGKNNREHSIAIASAISGKQLTA